jgi:hypothetical protein
MTTFLDVLPVDFKQTSDLLHSKIVERRFFRLGHTRRIEDISRKAIGRWLMSTNLACRLYLTLGITGKKLHCLCVFGARTLHRDRVLLIPLSNLSFHPPH